MLKCQCECEWCLSFEIQVNNKIPHCPKDFFFTFWSLLGKNSKNRRVMLKVAKSDDWFNDNSFQL